MTFSTATANNAASAVKLDTFTGDGSQILEFVLSEAVVDEKVTQVYINGVYQNKSTYSIDSDLVTLRFGTGNAPPNSSAIEVISFKTITSTDGTLTATTFFGDLNGTINTATTATTQSAGNNSTLVATTEFATTALNLKSNIASPTFTGTVGGITKAMVGLSNVDNTTDANKPVSTAGQTALDLKANIAGPTFTGDTGAANLTLSGYLRGPASFVIDPAAHGNDTGTLVVAGNLQVDGTTTTINSTTVSIDDLNFSIATDAADSAAANGAGITIGGAGASLTYSHSGTKFVLNKPLDVTGAGTFSGVVSTTSASSIGFLAQTTANSVHPYFRWVGNNRSYWAAAIDNGTDDATFKIGSGNTIGSNSLFTIDSATNTATFSGTLSGTSINATSFNAGTGTFNFSSGDALLDYSSGAVRLRTYKTAVGYITPLTINSQTGATTFSSNVLVNNATNDGVGALQVKTLAANQSAVRIASTTNNNLFNFISNDTPGHAILDLGKFTESGTYAAGFIRLRTDGNSWIQGGNLGIGTSSPGAKLHNYSTATTNVFITGYGTAAQNDWQAQNAFFVKTDNGILISKENANNDTNRLFNFYNNASAEASMYMYRGGNTSYIKLDTNGNSYLNGGNVGIGNTNPKFYLHSNDDVTIPNNRYLNFTSEINAANFNKSLVVSYTDDSATSQPKQIGLILHNNSNTDNTFSPALVFGSKSASNNYSQATAAIAGKRLTLQQDTNWHSGELYFWTATSGGASINQGIPADAPAMILDSRRRMRVPSQPSFSAKSSATIDLTSVEAKLALDAETYDIGGVYDPSNRRFTAPVAGRYLFTFTASVMELGGGQYNAVFIKVNGAATGYRFRAPGNRTNSEWGGISGNAILNLAANDYVELFGYVASGYIRLVAGEAIWGGHLLG
jgi:hypothetical protein